MSLRKNILANYASQVYVAGIGILILPLYIKHMGEEAYGLVGFFTMLQAFFLMLDLGLTPTISRESARYHGGALSALKYKQLHRALSLIFLFIAVVGGSLLFMSATYLSNEWLKINKLPLSEVVLSLQIMAVSVSLRWLCGLYRGVITGAEKLVWLSLYNVVMATFRFVLVLPIMWWLGATPTVFFSYQLLIAALELFVIYLKGSLLLPKKNMIPETVGWSFRPVKSIISFSLTIAFTSSIWVLVTQADKLILSGILSLEEYGPFTLAVMLSSGIMLISGPITSAIMPRMARLYAESQHKELISTYRGSTQLVTVVAGSAAVVMVVFAYRLIFAWTGNELLAKSLAPILQLYAAGYGMLAISAFPYYLQYARGDLRYHLIGSLVLLVMLFPSLVFLAHNYGAIGAGWAWLSANAIYLLFWVGYVHSKIEKKLHFSWVVKDVAAILIPALSVALFCYQVAGQESNSQRLSSLVVVLVSGFFVLSLAAISSSFIRKSIKGFFEKNVYFFKF